MIKSTQRVIGILASVDSGKTTLAEGLLFHGGALRRPGRVDHGDAFLDTAAMERERGITIFSKVARLSVQGEKLILLDTPGHADFTPETERTLRVLDACILVINGADGVTAQTARLWELLRIYAVPVVVFINKIDQAGVDLTGLRRELIARLSDHIVDFTGDEADLAVSEDLAALSEPLLDEFLSRGQLSGDSVRRAIADREVFPCYAGSALKDIGVAELLTGIRRWIEPPRFPDEFSARVYKISRDEAGQRLTWIRVTGGELANKSLVGAEKIHEIRLYSGPDMTQAQSVEAGEICALTGLRDTRAGQVLGGETEGEPVIFPVLRYRVVLESGGDPASLLRVLRELEEEMPDLQVTPAGQGDAVEIRLMGDLMLQVIQESIRERGGMTVRLDDGGIIYRETIMAPVRGIGHFEPLRHYAEVHLELAPSTRPGITVTSALNGKGLSPTREQQVLSWLRSSSPTGPLLGAALSHVAITLTAGREHERHTQGGDLREAASRALRQGLLQARAAGACRILEPWYEFSLSLPMDQVGRVLNDLDRLGAGSLTTRIQADTTLVIGRGPVATLRGYFRDLLIQTRGSAGLSYEFGGYEACHDEAAVLAATDYDPERDPANPAGSIFCSGGAGYFVPWDQVPAMAHIPLGRRETGTEASTWRSAGVTLSPEEVDQILRQTLYANANEKKQWKKPKGRRDTPTGGGPGSPRRGPAWLLVDGYNVIHAWPELAGLAKVSFDGAREKLAEVLSNYQGFTGETVELVFDAWKVPAGTGSRTSDEGISVIFTRENETADRWIERRAMELSRDHSVKVVTSDQAEQMVAAGTGAMVYSARRFREIIAEVSREIMATWERKADKDTPNRPLAEGLSEVTTDESGTGMQ